MSGEIISLKDHNNEVRDGNQQQRRGANKEAIKEHKLAQRFENLFNSYVSSCISKQTAAKGAAAKADILKEYQTLWQTAVAGVPKDSKVQFDPNAVKEAVAAHWLEVNRQRLMDGPVSIAALQEVGFQQLHNAIATCKQVDANLRRFSDAQDRGETVLVSDQLVVWWHQKEGWLRITHAHKTTLYTIQEQAHYPMANLVYLMQGLKLESVSPYVPEEPIGFFAKLRKCWNS